MPISHQQRIALLSKLTEQDGQIIDELLLLAERHADNDFVNRILLLKGQLIDPLGTLHCFRIEGDTLNIGDD
jgi:hypothetical protein